MQHTGLETHMHTEHTHTHTSMYFCIDFLMPPYTQFGLLCATKAEVLSVKSRRKQQAKQRAGWGVT